MDPSSVSIPGGICSNLWVYKKAAKINTIAKPTSGLFSILASLI